MTEPKMKCPECGYYAQEYADPERFDEDEFEYDDSAEVEDNE